MRLEDKGTRVGRIEWWSVKRPNPTRIREKSSAKRIVGSAKSGLNKERKSLKGRSGKSKREGAHNTRGRRVLRCASSLRSDKPPECQKELGTGGRWGALGGGARTNQAKAEELRGGREKSWSSSGKAG